MRALIPFLFSLAGLCLGAAGMYMLRKLWLRLVDKAATKKYVKSLSDQDILAEYKRRDLQEINPKVYR
tara:strand:+ start:280328 stop:280531 length:204 start_codon:yes stop_codon:yes gene_type:complete